MKRIAAITLTAAFLVSGCSNSVYEATEEGTTIIATIAMTPEKKPLINLDVLKSTGEKESIVLGTNHFVKCDVASDSDWYCFSAFRLQHYKMTNGQFSVGFADGSGVPKSWTLFKKRKSY